MLGILLFIVLIVASVLISPWFLLVALVFIVLQAWANSGGPGF